MNEHGACEHELFDSEGLQRAQQALGTAYRDFIVFRVRLTGEIEVRGQVNDRREMLTICNAYPLQGCLDTGLRREIHADAFGNDRRVRRQVAIESDAIPVLTSARDEFAGDLDHRPAGVPDPIAIRQIAWPSRANCPHEITRDSKTAPTIYLLTGRLRL